LPTTNAYSASLRSGGKITINTTAANTTDFGLVRLIKTALQKYDRIARSDQVRINSLRGALLSGNLVGPETGKMGSAACFQRRHTKYIKYSALAIFTVPNP
jgi:hypothetical protein